MIATIIIIIMLLYLALIFLLAQGIDKVDEFVLSDVKPKHNFSIVVPFRNEERNLSNLMDSIKNLNYPRTKFEVIFVNDESSDKSVNLIQQSFQACRKLKIDINLINNSRISKSPKKDAITAAISRAKYDWIVTTDADCIVPKYWLDAFDDYIQSKDVDFIIGPVSYGRSTSFLKRFQTLEFLSLQGATMGGFGWNIPFLSNGANMAYLKSDFETLNGFHDNNHITSGDDVFLLDTFYKNNKKVGYLKNNRSMVTTTPESAISGLIQQRLRWASKTNQSKNKITKTVGLIVFMGNLVCTFLLPFLVFDVLSTRTAILLFIIKFCIDFLLLFKVIRFFKQEYLLYSYILSSFLYPFFSTYIALLSLFAPFKWKGRKFRA